MATLCILDAPSVFSRAHRTTRPQFTSSDFPTNALYGFLRALISLQTENRPRYLVAVTETRNITEARLKEGGVAPDEALMQQILHVPRILETFSIPTIDVPGQRSADVAATLARMAVADRLNVLVIACGHDYYQVLAKGISVENPFTRKRAEHGDIIARFGIPPARIPDYLALVGDTAGGTSGIPGIGPGMARLLLAQFGSMDRILQHTDQIERPGLRERIRENADILRLASRLATFDSGIPLSWSPKDFESTPIKWPGVMSILREFELASLVSRIPEPENPQARNIAESVGDVQAFIPSVGKRLFLRVESEGSPLMKRRPVGLALATTRENALYVPIPREEGPEMSLVLAARSILENPEVEKVGHNLKADTLALRQLGIGLKGQAFDTCLADRLLAPKRNAHTLGTVALAHLPRTSRSWGEVDETAGIDGQPSREKAAACLSEAVAIIADLPATLESGLKASGLFSLFVNLDIPMIPILADMEHEGVRVNEPTLQSVLSQIDDEISKVRRRVAFLAGDEFEPSSDREVREILFNRLRLTPPRKAPQGYAVDDDVLEDLAGEHDLPQELLDHRYLDRTRMWGTNTLIQSREMGSVPVTAIEHAMAGDGFHPLNPLPLFVLDTWQPALREVFVPSRGQRLVCGHYSCLELRVLAHLSHEADLVTALQDRTDPVLTVAARLFDAPPDSVSPEMYRRALAVQSAVERGIGHMELARHLGTPGQEGRGLLDLYWSRFPSVRSWINETSEQIRREGWAATVFGRGIPLPPAGSGGGREWMLSLLHRMASLALYGTTADIIRTAANRLSEAFRRESLSSRLGGFILGGDILIDAAADEVERVLVLVQDEMEAALKLSVPIVASAGSGHNWAEARRAAEEVLAQGWT